MKKILITRRLLKSCEEKASNILDKIINLEKDDDLNIFFNILNEDE